VSPASRGGSITAGLLRIKWGLLAFQHGVASNFENLIVTPLRAFWGRLVDAPASGEGALMPWKRVSDAAREALAALPTHFAPFSDEDQARLINWGYALCDAAMRRYVIPDQVTPAPAWPYPNHPSR
jgi:hypothetical protein